MRRRQEYREPENGPPVVDLLTGEVPLAERHVERIIIAWSEHGRGAEGAFLRLRFAVQISGGVPTEGTPTSTYFNGLAVFTFATVADILSMEPRFAGAGGRFTPYVTGLGRRAVVIGFDAEVCWPPLFFFSFSARLVLSPTQSCSCSGRARGASGAPPENDAD